MSYWFARPRRTLRPELACSLVALALLTAACSAPSAPGAPGARAASTAVAAPAPTAGAGAQPGAAAATSGGVAPGGLRLSIQANGSEARYRAQEVLVRLRVPSEAVGRAKPVSGTIVLDASGKVDPAQSKVIVDLRQLTSDESQRDRFVRTDVLQTNRFPNAEFVPRDVQGIPWPAPSTGSFNLQLSGDLTVHGVTRPVTWSGSGQIAGNQVTATASTRVKMTDFGIPIPRVPVLLSLEDELTLELDVTATTG